MVPVQGVTIPGMSPAQGVTMPVYVMALVRRRYCAKIELEFAPCSIEADT
jgi:hypothetical protein